VNENKEIIFKCDHLNSALKAVDGLTDIKRKAAADSVNQAIMASGPKEVFFPKWEFENLCEQLATYSWGESIKN
jgi:hypothetical protein